MNKMIKGSIAGATGVALLMGGFGTYALWSDSADMPGDSITTGTLDVAAGQIDWTDGTTIVTDNANWPHLMVPGDTVTRTQEFTFSGSGKNLTGAIRFVDAANTGASNPADAPSLADSFDVTVDVAGGSLTEDAGGDCWEFTVDDIDQVFATTVDFELTADNQDLQDVTATLADASFTVTQNAAC